MTGILQEICRRRSARIAAEGPTLGVEVPVERRVPLLPFAAPPSVICEIKRRSPSRGAISADADPVAAALGYRVAGVRSVSVLTEQDYFGGSLADLMAVKAAAPDIAVLRKDFLQTTVDIDVAYRAGADAVLLIAAILDDDALRRLFSATAELGLTALVEVHTEEELRRVAPLQPPLLGINSRNLETFQVDRLNPVALRHLVDWPCSVIFESGIWCAEDARFAAVHGFGGVLVGEAAMRDPALAPALVEALTAPAPGATPSTTPTVTRSAVHAGGFWTRVATLRRASAAGPPQPGGRCHRPLVKICGITNREDAVAAVRGGADMLGFVYADSPRRAPLELPRELGDIDVLKVAVVVPGGSPAQLPDGLLQLLAEGALDAVQLHGEELPPQCAGIAAGFAYYKALRLGSAADAQRIEQYRSPRVLVDTHVAGIAGGTGRRLAAEIIDTARKPLPLWLAGGIAPQNVAEIITTWQPELIDLSSSLESRPGKKDHARIAALFAEIDRVSRERENATSV